MHRTELKISGRVLEVRRTEGEKQVRRSIGVINSKMFRFISIARSSTFPDCVRMCSVVSTVSNWDIIGAVFVIQSL